MMEAHVGPDYHGGSLPNLMASIALHFGIDTGHPPLAEPLPLAGIDCICLLVVDGLGYLQWRRHLEDGAMPHLHTRLAAGGAALQRITSVFPSTTAAALTSIYTGCTPAQHGRLGYSVYQGRSVVELLSFTDLDTGRPLRTSLKVGSVPTVFERLSAAGTTCVSMLPAYLQGSALSRWHEAGATAMPYGSPSQIPKNIAEVVHARGPIFLLLYAPDYDTAGHLYGSESAMAGYQATRIDWLIEAVLQALPRSGRTMLLVTADHGQVQLDPSRAVDLRNLPGFAAHLSARPAGDRMVRYLSLRSEAAGRVRETLEGVADLLPALDLWRQGFFGDDAVSRTFPKDIGDIIALPRRGRQLLWRYRAWEEEPWLGGHGGLSADEMYVPLVVL